MFCKPAMSHAESRFPGLRPWLLLCLVLAGMALGSCGMSVQPLYQSQSYKLQEFYFAAHNKIIPAQVIGNPFAIADDVLARHVTAAMAPEHWPYRRPFRPEIRFTSFRPIGEPDELPKEGRGYFVRVFFGLDRETDPNLLCAPAPPLAAPESQAGTANGPKDPVSTATKAGTIAVHMAFCQRERLLAASLGEEDNITGVEDPAFLSLIAYTTRALVPDRSRSEYRTAQRFGTLTSHLPSRP